MHGFRLCKRRASDVGYNACHALAAMRGEHASVGLREYIDMLTRLRRESMAPGDVVGSAPPIADVTGAEFNKERSPS